MADVDAENAHAMTAKVASLESAVEALMQRNFELARRIELLEGTAERRRAGNKVAPIWWVGGRMTVSFALGALRSLVTKTLVHFLTFVYFTKLHRWLISLSYKYYVLVLLR